MEQVDIKGFENYQITDDGRVWSKITNKWLKQCINSKGYLVVSLTKSNKTYPKRIHRLVAEAFVPNPDNKPCVDHIIPISEGGTNEASNLRWVTQEENCNNPLSLINYSEAQKGKKLSDETREKMAAFQKKRFEDKEERMKISEKMKGKLPANTRKVHQYTLDGEFVKEWDSTRECGRNGFYSSGVARCCRGEQKKHKGYIWKYAQ